jgi:hypothetical protein
MIGGYVAFASEGDPAGATDALRKAGFFVMRVPETYRSQIEIPRDDFLLVCTNAPEDYDKRDALISTFMDNVDAIVEPYGGLFDDVGTLGDLGDPDPWECLFS